MTMGPEPRIRIFEMSVRLGIYDAIFLDFGLATISPFPLLHHRHEIFKQIMRVMRPRRGLRVILHAEQRQVPVPQAFESRVVQVDVRQLNFTFRQRIRIDREVVVMRCDLDLTALQLLYRMIPTVVAKLQLESFSAKRNADELMS